MRNVKRCRQLSVAVVLLGLWASSSVLAAKACTVDECRDDCAMHKLVRAHEMVPGECGRPHGAPALAARCTCGEIHGRSSSARATLTTEAWTEPAPASSLHLAVLPTPQPHLPFYARFLGKEPTHRLARIDAPVRPGLRAPPAA